MPFDLRIRRILFPVTKRTCREEHENGQQAGSFSS